MGKRLLRAWMLRPSVDVGEINCRLDAVAALGAKLLGREELRRALDGILDLERLLSRVTLETANPRDVLALGASLAKLPGVKAALVAFATQLPNAEDAEIKQGNSSASPASPASSAFCSSRLRELLDALDELPEVRACIEQTIAPEPPLTFADGGVIRDGVNRDLDALRAMSRNSRQYVASIEERERRRTGIASLKVKFNSIFGYYIEVTKPNLHLVPPDYERKQTLVNAERFTTPELKEYESKILDAQEKILELERQIFGELRAAIGGEARRLRQTSLAVAEVDVLASLAHLAVARNYCRPELVASDGGAADLRAAPPATGASPNNAVAAQLSGVIEIKDGRHPVVEQQELAGGTERFVPNDLFLNSTSHSIVVLTGPNMGGKSTYLRQTALIVIMAQMGGFVPARSARLSIVDRIFTRIGASDNLARGRSTFMVEMTETATILNTATAQSLVLLDEIGRGTATYDGLAIAWAGIEYLHARTRARTLFATHYHELTELAERLSGVKNYRVSVKESGGNVVFLRKVEPGAADRSYGIEVAKLAGLPAEVIGRAREVLAEHESAERELTAQLESGAAPPEANVQLTMFTPLSQKIVEALRAADLNRLTPLDAMNLLAELKRQIE
jgi:DNA mismatch repair protein MutS